MSIVQILVNLLAYACFTFGALFVWPSRRNVLALLAIPFFIVAYAIPLAVIDYNFIGTSGAIDKLTKINSLGAVAALVGLLFGAASASVNQKSRGSRRVSRETPLQFFDSRVRLMMAVGCTLMSVSFVWMGMLPIFVDDPLLAKFFRGEYKVRYDQVAILYRFGQVLVSTTLPAAFTLLLDRRSRSLMFMVVWALALFIVSLNRGTVGAGALLVAGAWCSRSRWKTIAFVAITSLIFCIGSGVYALLGLVGVGDSSLLLEIARGAPDVTDHLAFITAFNADHDLTYGMTFVGGLIPGNFFFNPAVFTLAIVNGTADVSDLASGGLRLPPSLAGYAAYSWPGVVFVCAVSGFFTGRFTRLLQKLPRRTTHQHMVGILWYQTYALFIISFYAMSYVGIIGIVVLTAISFRPTRINDYLDRQSTRATKTPRSKPKSSLVLG